MIRGALAAVGCVFLSPPSPSPPRPVCAVPCPCSLPLFSSPPPTRKLLPSLRRAQAQGGGRGVVGCLLSQTVRPKPHRPFLFSLSLAPSALLVLFACLFYATASRPVLFSLCAVLLKVQIDKTKTYHYSHAPSPRPHFVVFFLLRCCFCSSFFWGLLLLLARCDTSDKSPP